VCRSFSDCTGGDGATLVKLLVFGNLAIPSDNLALKVGDELKKDGQDVSHLDDPLGLLKIDFTNAVILDVAEGVQEPLLITDVDRLVIGRLCSLHDFDMAFFLKLMKRLGKVAQVRIIALPQQMDVARAADAVRGLLAKLAHEEARAQDTLKSKRGRSRASSPHEKSSF
jgi:hypothetical protein